MTTETIDQRAERLVRQEVNVCLSGLVSTLANGYGVVRATKGADTLADLIEQAFELCTPVQDWEEAARGEGWEEFTDEFGVACWRDKWGKATFAGSAEGLCAYHEIDPYEWDFEHWSVSEWLADRLIEQGERVDTDFAGMCVWGRATTGQAIAMDSVVRRIVEKLYAAEAA